MTVGEILWALFQTGSAVILLFLFLRLTEFDQFLRKSYGKKAEERFNTLVGIAIFFTIIFLFLALVVTAWT